MSPHTLREVSTPYIVSADHEAIGQETVVIRRNGEPVAVVMPYAEYVKLLVPEQAQSPQTVSDDSDFERERAAFQCLLPELLKTHRGKWVAIANEQAIEFGPDFGSVIRRTRKRLGQRPVYVQEIVEKPRVYKMDSPRIVR